MNKNSTIVKTIFAFAVFTAVVVFLNYVVGMPTTKRMNFMLMTYGVGATVALLAAMIFPRLHVLSRIVQIGCLASFVLGVIALGLTIVCFVGKFNFPFVSTQWYGLLMVLAVISTVLYQPVVDSNAECWAEFQDSQNRKPKVSRAESPSSTQQTT